MISQRSFPSYRGHVCTRDVVEARKQRLITLSVSSVAPFPFRNDARSANVANASGSGLERGVVGGYF